MAWYLVKQRKTLPLPLTPPYN